VNHEVQIQVERSFHTTQVHGGRRKQEKLLRRVRRANGKVHRIERCAKPF
jgi:hypothetical protein